MCGHIMGLIKTSNWAITLIAVKGQKPILSTRSAGMTEHQALQDISSSKVKQPLVCLFDCENVNYCIPIMGRCDPAERNKRSRSRVWCLLRIPRQIKR